MQRFDLELRVLLALAFVNGLADSSIVPLLPSIRDDLGLSPVGAGMLFATTTLAMLVARVAGRVRGQPVRNPEAAPASPPVDADRTRGQASPTAFRRSRRPARLRAQLRDPLGVGPARAAAGGRGAGGTGPLIAASGAGWLVGPVVAGAIADAAGWRVASAVLAVATYP